VSIYGSLCTCLQLLFHSHNLGTMSATLAACCFPRAVQTMYSDACDGKQQGTSLPTGTCPANLRNGQLFQSTLICQQPPMSYPGHEPDSPSEPSLSRDLLPGSHFQLNLELLSVLTLSSDDLRHTFLIVHF